MWKEVGIFIFIHLTTHYFKVPRNRRKYRKSYCTTLGIDVGVGSGGCVGVNIYVKVLRQSFDGFSFYLV